MRRCDSVVNEVTQCFSLTSSRATSTIESDDKGKSYRLQIKIIDNTQRKIEGDEGNECEWTAKYFVSVLVYTRTVLCPVCSV